MEPVVFAIPGPPRAKGRPRATIKGGFARVYTDAETRKYEQAVALHARAAMGRRPPFDGPLKVALLFRLEVPKSYSKRVRAAMLAGEQPYFGANDIDNLAKAVLDGMNAVCFLDDKQIVKMSAMKIAHALPGVDVKITPW